MTLTNSRLHRRQFLRTALATAGGIAALPALRGLGSLTVNGRVHAAPGKGGYGPLIPMADERDGGVRMALPEGFKYRSFSAAGDTMSDGNLERRQDPGEEQPAGQPRGSGDPLREPPGSNGWDQPSATRRRRVDVRHLGSVEERGALVI